MIAPLTVEDMLREAGAWQTGHFLLSSGLHSDQYVQCQKVLQYPRYGLALAASLVERIHTAGICPRTVVGPALGAVHWEVYVACALDERAEAGFARGVFAERPDGTDRFSIRRGIEIIPGEPVLVVEDVTTTGGSARKVVDLVRELGGEPVAVGAIVDRSGGAACFDVPFFSLIRFDVKSYQPESCPLCREGTPPVKPGSTKKPGA